MWCEEQVTGKSKGETYRSVDDIRVAHLTSIEAVRGNRSCCLVRAASQEGKLTSPVVKISIDACTRAGRRGNVRVHRVALKHDAVEELRRRGCQRLHLNGAVAVTDTNDLGEVGSTNLPATKHGRKLGRDC